jgi:hypothetical protein
MCPVMCAFSFMNSKRHKGRATWRKGKGAFTVACYCAGEAEAALPVSCCQRAACSVLRDLDLATFLRTLQNMLSIIIHGALPQRGNGLVFCELVFLWVLGCGVLLEGSLEEYTNKAKKKQNKKQRKQRGSLVRLLSLSSCPLFSQPRRSKERLELYYY